jgi:hypothetical protein
MEIVKQLVPYFFPTLLALAILYFFAAFGEVKHSADYKKIDMGKKGMFKALAYMFWILAIWGVVYSVIAVIA